MLFNVIHIVCCLNQMDFNLFLFVFFCSQIKINVIWRKTIPYFHNALPIKRILRSIMSIGWLWWLHWFCLFPIRPWNVCSPSWRMSTCPMVSKFLERTTTLVFLAEIKTFSPFLFFFRQNCVKSQNDNIAVQLGKAFWTIWREAEP